MNIKLYFWTDYYRQKRVNRSPTTEQKPRRKRTGIRKSLSSSNNLKRPAMATTTISKIRLQNEKGNGIHMGERQIERKLYAYGTEQEDIQPSYCEANLIANFFFRSG
jgi:hypothetical protein